MATGISQPPRPARRSSAFLLWTIGILALLFLIIPLFVSLYSDFLWFGGVDFRRVFTTAWGIRILLFLIFGVVSAAVTYAAARLTWRARPDTFEGIDVNSPLNQYRESIEKLVHGLLIIVPGIIGVLGGLIGQSAWRTVLMFFNRQSFGKQDPQFHLDYGFYSFTLPFLQLIVGALATLVAVSFIIELIGFYLLGSIRLGNKVAGISGYISKRAGVTLSVTAGVWMLIHAVTYWLDRYSLLYTDRGIFTGAGYTDINAKLPAKIILMVIAVLVAAAFFFSVVYRDLRVPGLGLVLMVLSALAIGQVWPLIVEQFSVNPNRAAKESQYISRNMDATKYAYGLTDDKVSYDNEYGKDSSNDDNKTAADSQTISNIRLLDPDIISPTFTQMQQLRNFYGFPDKLSMDRCQIDGQMRDFVVAAREVDPKELRDNQLDWINRHTVYTHGNGFVAAQANTVDEAPQEAGSTRGGFPVFTVSDLQTNQQDDAAKNAKKLGIKADQPRVYYGPVIASSTDGADYAIVGDTGKGPVEYDTDNSSFTYDGKGGVNIGNWFNRLTYALKYQQLKLILSDRVGDQSKIIYDRDPRQRVEKVAPWLTTDNATYPAVIDGHIKWIVDGYTTLSALPYSQQTSLTDTTRDTLNPNGTNQPLINDKVGYIRNSVKATVDAYDGTVTLYQFDQDDPVLKAWMGAFPNTVKPNSEIPNELRDHFRYPLDMFKVQRELLAKYHVTDPGVFFSNDAFWSVPGDPTAGGEGQKLAQPPYYVVAADPQKRNRSSFQLITPYRGLNREFLAAQASVSSDPSSYGHISVKVLPTNTQTQGPRQAQDAMMSSDQVARDRTLWQGTNTLYNGNLLTLPIGDGEILYAEPIYSQRSNQDSAFPKLLRVLVSYKGRVGYAPTIAQALSQVGINPQAANTVAGDKKPDAQPQGQPQPSGQPASGSGNAGDAINNINKALDDLNKAKGSSHEAYGKALDELDKAVQDYQKTQQK